MTYTDRYLLPLLVPALLVGCGSTGPDPDADPIEAAALVQANGSDLYRLIGLGLDSDSLAEAEGLLGAPLANVEDLGPAEDGMPKLQIHVDAFAPAPVYEFLLSSWQDKVGPLPASSPELNVFVGTESGAKIGLLLPAVQKFESASIDEDGAFLIEVGGAATIQPIDDGALANEGGGFSGGVRVATGDVNGFMSATAEAGSIDMVVAPVAAAPQFSGSDGAMLTAPIQLVRPAELPDWFDFAQPVSLTIDVREPGGDVLHRFRMTNAIPQADDGLTITLAPAKAGYLKIGDIKGEAVDEEAIAAMVEMSYAGFSPRSYDVAKSQVQAFVDLSSAAAPTLAEVRGYWSNDRDGIITLLHNAAAHAADHEGLLCQAALPTTLSLARSMSERRSELSEDPVFAVATSYEAARAFFAPSAGAYAGGPLGLAAFVDAEDTADVGLACRALMEAGPFIGSLEDLGVIDSKISDAAKLSAFITIFVSPRTLDREMVEWIELLDALLDGTVEDQAAALAEARSRAEALVESLGDHATVSQARHDLAHFLLDL